MKAQPPPDQRLQPSDRVVGVRKHCIQNDSSTERRRWRKFAQMVWINPPPKNGPQGCPRNDDRDPGRLVGLRDFDRACAVVELGGRAMT
jgi:hypothetical protein